MNDIPSDHKMKAGKRKYSTEFAINMFGSYRMLLQQDALVSGEVNELIPSDVRLHIYMIARRPRIAFDVSTLKLTRESFSGTFTVQRGADFERHDFNVPNRIGVDNLRIESSYPYTEFKIMNDKNWQIAGGKVPLLVTMLGTKFWHLMDLEILYVGQAYGEDGSRVAPDRLQSHSTLQGIYAEANRRSPDMDIWLIMWSFEPLLITSFDGIHGSVTTPAEDDEHREKVLQGGITEQQQINFTEAALIRYFKPKYNTMFKDTFPSPAHKTYAQCYDLDLNAVNVELQTEEIRCRLWSPSVAPIWTHFAKFDLHSKEDRMGMFDFG